MNAKKNSLLIIDGMALAYRAFFAIRELSTSDGRKTNALFGFIKMIEQLQTNCVPTHWCAVFDGGLPDERTNLLESYKAQREPTPDDLKAQLEPISEYLHLRKVPTFRMEGQEADDIMATIAKWAIPQAKIMLATSDKDLFQVVNENIFIVSPSKNTARMGPEEVYNKTGVKPDLMTQWQALIGDKVDNIQGIPGVGPKTAAKWLNEYGSIENIYNNLSELKPERFRKLLSENQALVERNLKLVKLRDDLKVDVSWEQLKVQIGGRDELLEFFDSYEFRSMANALRSELPFG